MELLELLKAIVLANAKILVLVLIAVVVDTVLGITKAKTNHNFEYTSRGFKRLYPKLITYCAVILFFIFFDWAFSIQYYIFTRGICIILIINEITSIKENTKDIPLLDTLIDKAIKIVKKE